MKIKVGEDIYEVTKIVYDPFDKCYYYYVEGMNTPFCDLDDDIEELDEKE